MTDEFDDIDPDPEDGDNLVKNLRAQLKAARKEVNEYKELATAGQQAVRERAFDKAGIPDTKLGQMFRKSYDGDVTPEAIRAAAVEYELIAEDTTAQTEINQIEGMAQVAQGAETPDANEAQYLAELDVAARVSSQAVADVMRKFGKRVA